MPEGHLIATSHALRLDRFLGQAPARRVRYFGLVEDLQEALHYFHGAEPLPTDVRLCVVQALSRDGAFRAYVEDQAPDDCCDQAKWERIVLAGAGTIMGQYERAREAGD
jgi:hypothetical protein